MTQKYNLRKYEQAAKLILNAVGVSPPQLGFLEKLVRLEDDKSRVRKIRAGFSVPGNGFLQNVPMVIDVYVKSGRFAYTNYVKNYLKKKQISFKSRAGCPKFWQFYPAMGDPDHKLPTTYFHPFERICVAVSKDRIPCDPDE